MSEVVIKIEQLSKLYRLGEVGTGTLVHDLNRWWHQILGKDDPYAKVGQSNDRTQKSESDYVWALEDVSFEVRSGEVLGIIGRNGAGKSTLLKILSRVTRPTSGEIKIKGRVASLLEVGTGFHPELTGRENTFLNGAILGMSRQEIASKFDEIVAFSGCERYIDTPVKRYSSGMKVRLGFAVAAHLNPDILVVDEVLAVGDAEFQKKCLGRMDELKHDGRSVIFVSHQMGLVRALCSRALRMVNGRVVNQGPVSDIISNYLNDDTAPDAFTKEPSPNKPLQFISLKIASLTADSSSVTIQAEVLAEAPRKAGFDIRIKEASSAVVGYGSIGTLNENELIEFKSGVNHLSMSMDTRALANGSYTLSFDVLHPNIEHFDRAEDCIRFSVDRAPLSGAQRVLQQSWGYGSYEVPVHLQAD